MEPDAEVSSESVDDEPPSIEARPFCWSDITREIEGRATSALMRQNGLSRAAASDLVVDAALRLARLKPVARNVPALLMRTAQNIFATRASRERKLRDCEQLSLSPEHDLSESSCVRECASAEDDVVDQVERKEALERWTERLKRAKCALRASDREILDLHYVEEIPLIDIDDMRDHRRGTAKVALHRARERLRRALSQSSEARNAR